MKTPNQELEASLKVVELHPSLAEVVSANGLNRSKLTVGLKLQNDQPNLSADQQKACRNLAKEIHQTLRRLN